MCKIKKEPREALENWEILVVVWIKQVENFWKISRDVLRWKIG
jgi:hypothetical protein